jgi:integrase
MRWILPYAQPRRERNAMSEDLEQLKQRLPLLDYLRRHNWTGHHVGAGDEFVGLCPLHPDQQPSFYINARKNLFYCHGCNCGGDLIRFVELSKRLSFRESIAHLKQEIYFAAESELLDRAAAFYQVQLQRHPEAAEYLQKRGLRDPGLIIELGLGYAPGGNLRRQLAAYGYGRPRRMMATGLRLKQPHRVIMPLSTDEVAKFWRSFRTFRDLALVALMLLNGLRSQETLDLQLEDLQLAEAQLRVLGKGNKPRPLPLPGETIQVIQNYLHLERPVTNSSALFVSLKGLKRGLPMTLAGLRSLFRHHRVRSQVLEANPHRFRHTFGADMVRAGISLPALQQLMGHAQIRTTMLYVQIAPQDVWREYARAVENRTRLSIPQDL